MKTFKFKLYQSKKNKRLERQVRISAAIYNHCIALHKRYYRLHGKSLNMFRLQKHITKLKKLEKYSFWNQVGSQAIQNITQRIDFGYKKFFKKDNKRPPTFRKSVRYKSFTLKQAGWALLGGNQIRIGKDIFKFSKSREIEGKIKTVTIKRDTLGNFFIFFACEIEVEPKNRTTIGKTTGIDFGLKTYLTFSDGTEEESPLFFKHGMKTIRKASQKLSSKKKGSNHRAKARLNLARKHKKIANQRKDYHFQLANKLCQSYEYIFIEDLNLRGMVKLWGRKVNDLGFSDFIKILEHTATKHRTTLHKIDRWFPSSKLCSGCGTINKALSLRDRDWVCDCGSVHNRDHNAAINILREGSSSLGLGDVRQDESPAIAA
jgi:putative transposase